MRKKKSKRLIAELTKRRDEVVTRAKMVANKQIPQFLLDRDLVTALEWIIIPHIKETYDQSYSVDDKGVRGFQKVIMKVFKAMGIKKQKGEKIEKSS